VWPSRLALCVAGLFLAGALLIRIVHRTHRQGAERRRVDWLKYAVYVLVINGLWGAAYVGRGVAASCLAVVAIGGTLEVLRLVPAPYRVGAAAAAMALFFASLWHLMLEAPGGWQASFAFVVMVTASTDSFAQLSGRLVGRRKLCPRLSPEKTVVGLWGGLTVGVGVALLLGFLLPDAHGGRLALLGLSTALAAVVGDLLFSAVKRAAGVKDFSGILPGHGGMLDRFDSLLLAAPVFYWSRQLIAV